MTDKEFEKLIRETLKTDITPSRDSFSRMLSKLEDEPVTINKEMRYNREITTSNIIISKKISDIVSIWKSKRLVLIPSLIIVLIVSTFSLSSHNMNNNNGNFVIEQLAEQGELIEEPNDYDDEVIITSFDEPDVNGLSIIKNEL